MLRWIHDFLTDDPQDGDFRYHGFRIRGRRDGAKSANRVLLLADAYGPTLQINFIRPFRYQASFRQSWAWWTLTEESIRTCSSAAGPVETVAQLKILFNEFRPTIIIASRYGGLFAEEIISLAAEYQVPILSHLDDNLLAVPSSNGDTSFAKHADQERQHALRVFLSRAHLTYISTPSLYEQLLALDVLGTEVIVGGIAGAAAPYAIPPARKGTQVVFGYMGSQSHTGDLEMIAPAIAAVLQKLPQARFELFGSVGLPAALSAYKIVRHGRVKNYDQFLRRLSTLRWNFGLAPLAMNDFTMAKTNIKWIEYTAAGIPVLASDHPIYQECCRDGAGLLIAEDWQDGIARMIETPALGDNLLSQARRRLDEEFSPRRLHAQLMTVMKAAGATFA